MIGVHEARVRKGIIIEAVGGVEGGCTQDVLRPFILLAGVCCLS